jgi:F-type H+-transporting ATPase subunit b
MRFLTSLFIALLPVLAFAEEHGAAHGDAHGGAHAAGGIPASVVFQAINFVIFAGLGFYFLRKPIRNFFNGRRSNYHAALNKAEQLKRDAEQRKADIGERLRALEATSKQTLDQARAEAEAMSARILQEANELSKNLRDEAGRTAEAEVSRAKGQLRDELLNQSVALSKQILSERIVETDQKRLQTEFVDKIQEVR